jgi:RNA polymerase sigma-70 factor (ECF subfamily)
VTESRQHFQQVYLQAYADLVHFVMRRHQPPDLAEDIVAEAFTIAWQRLGDLPADHGEARAWLFGITRRLLLAQQRTQSRGQALAVRIAQQPSGPAGPAGPEAGHDDLVATSVDLANAWPQLAAVHQEALSLTVWEGLSGAQAAQVLGISPVAFRIRLSRARRVLRQYLNATQNHRPPASFSALPTTSGRPS